VAEPGLVHISHVMAVTAAIPHKAAILLVVMQRLLIMGVT
jgi:hypothetical protein